MQSYGLFGFLWLTAKQRVLQPQENFPVGPERQSMSLKTSQFNIILVQSNAIFKCASCRGDPAETTKIVAIYNNSYKYETVHNINYVSDFS